jgi:hypothetical protein
MDKLSNHLGRAFVIGITVFVAIILIAAIRQPMNASTLPATKYKIVVDSGKILKCDSIMWKKYDTLIPVPRTVFDTTKHSKTDTVRIKK